MPTKPVGRSLGWGRPSSPSRSTRSSCLTPGARTCCRARPSDVMNTLSLPVEDEGPMVDILVGLAAPEVLALRQAGRPVPAPVPARALLDTGASMSSVDPHVLQPLIAAANLPPSRFLFANLPMSGGLNFVSEYAVGLTLVHPSGDPRRNLV